MNRRGTAPAWFQGDTQRGIIVKTSELSEFDLYLFHQGTNYHAYEMLGAHFVERDGKKGVRFAVWAPHAKSISVVGDFNEWDTRVNPMTRGRDGEIWEVFIPDIEEGAVYKYAIEPQWGGPRIMKADPYGFYAEKKPNTASRVYDLSKYEWKDGDWFEQKKKESSYERPMLTYEVHAGSWRRTKDGEYLSYRDLADQLIDYVKKMNYTHIEFMPLCEHPFDGSWGYQITGYYAVTSRFGTPDDFRYLVDKAHENGIAIIMDWVPGHFCKDEQGLRHFDGQTLYESDNEQLAENWEWGTTNFDYGRTEVQSFLISNAMFWFEEFHIDGLRIDDVEPLLQLRQTGTPLGLRGLLVGGIVISALGAVMDVAMSIASALTEVHTVAPNRNTRELFRSGMNIGRDMVGTMTNTLILAFLGSGFALIIYLYSLGLSPYQLISSSYLTIEVVSSISSSIGVILSVPLTALISSVILTRGKG